MTNTISNAMGIDASHLADAERLTYQQTVPRHLVHRSAVSEVFVTDMAEVDQSTFLVAAQWPRRHSFFGPVTPAVHDPMLFAETVRQATLIVAHQALGAPLGHNFLYQDKSFWISQDGLRADDRPASILLVVRIVDGKDGKRSLANRKLAFECYRDGTQVGTASVLWSCVSPASYRRLRGERAEPVAAPAPLCGPVPPESVGRTLDEDVVLAPTPVDGAWALRVDQRHPVMFDHPVDHVPGMVAMEAARQAALLAVRQPKALPVGATFTFHRYIELDEPCVVTSHPEPPREDGGATVRVLLTQCGQPAVEGTFTMRLR